jgi:hypothetical protein
MDFDGTLRKAIDEAILGIFGQGVRETLYRSLEEKYSVTTEALPYRVKSLWEILEHAFGYVGSRTVGRSIARLFYSKLGLPFVAMPAWGFRTTLKKQGKNWLKANTGFASVLLLYLG